MAATVEIHEMSAVATGVNRTRTAVPGDNPIVFRSNDSNLQDNANPVQVPVAGTAYSFTKQTRLFVSVAPAVQLENLRAYSDGVNNLGTGLGIQYDINVGFLTQINTDIAGADFFGLTSGLPGDLGSGPYVGTGYHGSLLRLQLTVSSVAGPGQTQNDEPLIFAYDET